MDYAKYITAANNKKDSWDVKINTLKLEAEEDTYTENTASSSSTGSSSSSNTSSSTNRLDADDVSSFDGISISNDLDYASILKTTNDRTASISAQLALMREEAEAEEAREKQEEELEEYSSNNESSGDAKDLTDAKETLDGIKLRNEDPIEGFFLDILGRESDPEGKAYWQQKFDEGMSLDDIQEQFLRSDEYKNKPKD